ncbi:hypothetical protein [Undibacterium umbellatum]|jgi:hypothetical protein|uniref:SCP2 domain-containing protein n=1 Tax=Undibacterium umbellatum TaxID=2762300 RepID=A0ABR6ZEU9_9BURK|nr:hypothetical protein [Undibacterium umbellatum]MBC3910248.1 hypothetical protein [Undibacterium umbellatum]
MFNENQQSDSAPDLQEHPWISLETALDVEAWMDLQHRELQQALGDKPTTGQGICLTLVHGGELYLHTNSDGDVLLDLTEEAQWVAPVLTAVTRSTPPKGQVWGLPGHVLIQLILGLNTLIASSRLVLRHQYKGARVATA